uniref:Uncharacterized protein n=1 Tax=Octopus bimaculoides TaxID=37653 RepID=A0A0L8GNR0_OCTBM
MKNGRGTGAHRQITHRIHCSSSIFIIINAFQVGPPLHAGSSPYSSQPPC